MRNVVIIVTAVIGLVAVVIGLIGEYLDERALGSMERDNREAWLIAGGALALTIAFLLAAFAH